MADEPSQKPGSPDSPSLPRGKVLGHYEILECIGRGGMGEVYRALDHHLDRNVAIKVLQPRILEHARAREDFRHEADALSRLSHPNIATIHDFDQQDGIDFLVMEYVGGKSLTQRIGEGPLPHEEWVSIAMQICDALQEAHGQGIIHRDLKPGNVFLDERHQVKVLDFGLAKLAPTYVDSQAPTEWETQTERIIGTPPYMAPEQLRGAAVDARTDIYALGATLYELATGRRAFAAASHADVVASKMQGIIQPPRELRSDLSQKLEQVILRAIQPESASRQQTAEQFKDELEAAWKPKSGTGWLSRAVLAVLLVIAVIVVVSLVGQRTPLASQPELKPLVLNPPPAPGLKISPDGQWLGYLAMDGARFELQRAPRRGGRAQQVTANLGGRASFCWSEDSQRFAVTHERGGEWYLQLIPAFEGMPDPPISLPDIGAHYVPVRWVGDRVYLEATGAGLHEFDLASKQLEMVLPESIDGSVRNHFAVCPDGDHVLFEAHEGNARAIELLDLARNRGRRIAQDASRPSWLGSSCDRLVYSAGSPGQVEIWVRAITDEHAIRITTGGGDKIATSSSPDGKQIVYYNRRRMHQLGVYDLAGNSSLRPLTSGLNANLWPSGWAGSKWVAFQRTPPSVGDFIPILGSEILVAELRGSKLEGFRTVSAKGGHALISRDGSWVSCLRSRPPRLSLYALEVETLREVLVSEYPSQSPLYGSPLMFIERHAAWSNVGNSLYYVESLPAQADAVVRWRPDGSESVYSAPDDITTLAELMVDDVAGMLWVVEKRRSGDEVTARVRSIDLDTKLTRVLFERKLTAPVHHVLIRGLQPDGHILVLDSQVHREEAIGEQLTVHRVSPSGEVQTLPSQDGAFAGSACYDANGDLLLLLAAAADRASELRILDARTGELQRRITFERPSAELGSLTLAADGALLFSSDDVVTEDWIVNF